MAFEREMIAPNTSAQSSQPQAQMREERTIDPYKQVQRPIKIGQANTNVGAAQSAAAEEPAAVPAESVSLSPAAAALARKEQKFRQEQASLKARETALEKERLEIAEFKALKAKLDSKDYSAIEGMVPYDEYTNYHVNKLNGSSAEAQKIAELEAKITDVDKRHQDDVAKRFEAAVNERRVAVKKLVSDDVQFSSIKELNAEEAVIQHILDTWENDNVDLSPEQAAKEVEEIIVERAGKWAALSKMKPKTEIAEADQKNLELPPLKASVKTITNDMAPTGEIKRPQKSLHGMSDSERWAEARRRAEEKLKTKG